MTSYNSIDIQVQSREAHPDCLISVQDLSEFRLVMDSGVDIVDLKNPHSGPLAATDPEIWCKVAEQYLLSRNLNRNRAKMQAPFLSAALGELHEAPAFAGRLPEIFHFAKAGPSKCPKSEQLVEAWQEIRTALHGTIELVAVAYADWELAGSLPPNEIFALAAENGFKRCLIDTYTKDGRSALDFLTETTVVKLREFTEDQGLWFAFAGSLRESEVAKLSRLGVVPDCYAARGVVCNGDRSSAVCEKLLLNWLQLLRGQQW